MILKTVGSDDTMYDLVVNVIKNLNFYLEHRKDLADIGYSDNELEEYKNKLLSVIKMYEDNTIPTWFVEFSVNKFLSSQFPYKTSYLDFMLSFEDVVNTLFYNGTKFMLNNKQQIVDSMVVECGCAITIFYHCTDGETKKERMFLDKKEFQENFIKNIC